MNRKLYLLSTGLLIIGAILSTLSGFRSFLSPVLLFKIGTIINIIFSVSIGLLLAYMLCLRFGAVWKNKIDITMQAKTKHAFYIQRSARFLLYGYYMLLPIILLLIFFGGPIKSEIRFLFFPLLKVLPVGYILFEMSRLIDIDSRLKRN